MSRPLPSHRYRTRHSNNRISEAVVAIGALTFGSALFFGMSKLMDRSEIVRGEVTYTQSRRLPRPA